MRLTTVPVTAVLISGLAIFPAAISAASDSPQPEIVRTPFATYAAVGTKHQRSYSIAVVVRFDRALPRTGFRVVIGPHLRTGKRLRRIFGGDQPFRIGTLSKHCYTIEVGRPRPVSTPTIGARWRVALIGAGGTVVDTAPTTLRPAPRHRAFGPAEARRLGC